MKRILFTTVMTILMAGTVDGQCRSYTKRKCRPDLDPYIHDGKMNFVPLYAGDKAELMLTFYPGQEYRLLVCHSPEFDTVYVKVKDIDENVVYDKLIDGSTYFDFKVGSTQQLLVTIKVPAGHDNTTHDLDYAGCVSVLTGIKEEE